jgi:hypothetical protein
MYTLTVVQCWYGLYIESCTLPAWNTLCGFEMCINSRICLKGIHFAGIEYIYIDNRTLLARNTLCSYGIYIASVTYWYGIHFAGMEYSLTIVVTSLP